MENKSKKPTRRPTSKTSKTKRSSTQNSRSNATGQNTKNNVAKTGKKKKKRNIKKIILITILVIILLIAIAAGVLVGVFYGMFGDELKMDKKDLIVGATNSRVLDKDDNLLAVIAGDEKRQVVSLDEMSEYLPKAYVAIEDERFYDHHGVDIKRTASAIFSYILHKGNSSFGGSTITQQLIKNITEEDDRGGIEGIIRKVKEWARAYNVEKILSKDQILELYLNILFVGGNNLHGVELGARYYFDKPAKDLTLAECAFMAGINSEPSSYNAFSENEDMVNKINNKTKVVLAKMLETGAIVEEEYNSGIEEVNNGLPFKRGNITTNNLSYHTEAAINQVIEDYMELKECTRDMAEVYVYSSGLTIYTTQDSAIQERMEQEYARDIYQITSKKYPDRTSQSAMVIIDHKTGYVVGTVGGTGEKTAFGLNRATQSKRQTGSSMKPLADIAPALEEGIITAGKVYDDVPGQFKVRNYYGSYKGLSTVRYAIEISQNIIPTKILTEVGINKSLDFLEKAGITSLVRASENPERNDEGIALAIGGLTYGITPLEMAGAYAMIANDGVYIEPTFYTKVMDSEGNIVLEAKQDTRRVMAEGNAYILKSILTQPVVGTDRLATARKCAIKGMDVAAKTGTTDDNFDRWVCGFTPYYTTAIWYGYDENEVITGWSFNPCSNIFENIMTDIHKDLDSAKFVAPNNIVRATICRDSGLLATDECKDTINGNRAYSEVYVAGTQPKTYCKTHVKATVCEQEEGVYALSNEWCEDSQELVFITRPNSDTNTAWQSAEDAKFMLPTEYCTIHEKIEVQPDPIEIPTNTISNTTNTISGGNTIGNVTNTTNTTNTTGGGTTNTTGNTTGNNTNTTNTTGGATAGNAVNPSMNEVSTSNVVVEKPTQNSPAVTKENVIATN